MLEIIYNLTLESALKRSKISPQDPPPQSPIPLKFVQPVSNMKRMVWNRQYYVSSISCYHWTISNSILGNHSSQTILNCYFLFSLQSSFISFLTPGSHVLISEVYNCSLWYQLFNLLQETGLDVKYWHILLWVDSKSIPYSS